MAIIYFTGETAGLLAVYLAKNIFDVEYIYGRYQKIKFESEQLKQEVRQKTRDFILAAFGFVAGLAWNEAVKALIEEVFPQNNNSVWAN